MVTIFFNTFENKQFQIRCRFFFGHVVYVRDSDELQVFLLESVLHIDDTEKWYVLNLWTGNIRQLD